MPCQLVILLCSTEKNHDMSACDIIVFYRKDPCHVSLLHYCVLQRRTMSYQLVTLLCSTEKNHGMSACGIIVFSTEEPWHVSL